MTYCGCKTFVSNVKFKGGIANARDQKVLLTTTVNLCCCGNTARCLQAGHVLVSGQFGETFLRLHFVCRIQSMRVSLKPT